MIQFQEAIHSVLWGFSPQIAVQTGSSSPRPRFFPKFRIAKPGHIRWATSHFTKENEIDIIVTIRRKQRDDSKWKFPFGIDSISMEINAILHNVTSYTIYINQLALV